MVNIEVVQGRIKKIKDYLSFLKEIREESSLEEFKKDPRLYGSAERFLHLCIEALLDTGNHIIADEDLGQVSFYKDVPKILYENSYISENAKDTLTKMIGFRNILVHDYLELDHDIVFSVLKEDLEDIEEILKEIISKL